MNTVRASTGVDATEAHPPPGDEREAVELHALARHDLAALGIPARLEVVALHTVAGDRLDPFRLDAPGAARIQPRRFHELGREHPFRGLAGDARSGMQEEAHAACAVESVAILGALPDVAEEPGEERLVQRLVAPRIVRFRNRLVPAPGLLLRDRGELRMHVAPLAQAQPGHEPRAARIDQRAMRLLARELGLEELPQRDQRKEIRALVAKAQVRLVGGLLLLERPLARIGHRQRARDHEHLREAAALPALEDHPADARIHRQARELPAERRQRALVADGAELLQQLVAVGDRARQRRLEKGKLLDRTDVQRRHAQDHRRERRAQDLRVRIGRTRGEIRLGEETHAHARGHASATARALVGGGLRDLLDLQERGLVAHRVALDARKARVDHVADAGNGERGLGDVGREHDAPATARREHALLLRRREACEEREDLDVAGVGPAREAPPQELGRLADLALAGKEHEHVAGTLAPEVLGGRDDRVLHLLLVVALLVGGLERPVADLHRIQPPGHLDDRRGHTRAVHLAREVLREALGVDRRRGDDDLEIRAARQQLVQVAEQEVDVEAALVRLVHDDRVVRGEHAVALRLGEQDAVGHQLDERVGLGVVGEADLVADEVADLAA